MKAFKKLCALALAGVSLMSVTACELPFDLPFLGGGNQGGGEEETVKVEKISSDLLDGKVANLMSATGLGIEDKSETANGETATASEATAKDGLIVASADEGKMKQPLHELVKAHKHGVHDVRFHKKGKGSYREWNKRFEKHHHKTVECPKVDCDELSDEIEQEEANEPTILSMGARVNKLYNGGDYTFVCVSSEVEGEATLFTQMTPIQGGFDNYAFSGTYPTLINTPDVTEKGFVLSYLSIGSGEDKGMILVKTFESEESYHQVNYWSDNYNQSYVIDNQTGITYSLAKFPYIYSITGNVITVWKGEGTKKTFDYYTVSVENGELKFDELTLPEETSPYFNLLTQNPLVDIYGNIVFQSRIEINQMARNANVTLEGEQALLEELRYPENPKIIFTGYNQELFRMNYHGGRNPLNCPEFEEYRQSTRYFRGDDGKIYRFGFICSLNSIPVKVLDENGEWQDVPETANTVFAPQTGYMFPMRRSGMASHQTYFKVTEISNGYAYFSNATWGEEAGYVHGGCLSGQMENEPVGVIKMPVGGGADVELIDLTQKLATQKEDFVYRTGNTAMVYKDGANLVLWDRKTDVKSVIENVNGKLNIVNGSCFGVNNLYIPFSGVDFEWNLESIPTSPIERKVTFEAFYSLLIKKDVE